jgi:hypothetical protein
MKKNSSKSIQLLKYNIMKSYVLIPFLFTSLIALSQHEKKRYLAFRQHHGNRTYEQLYTKINTLQLEKMKTRSIYKTKYDYTKLKEYFFDRIYIKVFDQLELGITPDSLQLQNYFRPVDKKIDACKLDSFDIPKPDSKSIIIFIDPEIDAALKGSPMVPL